MFYLTALLVLLAREGIPSLYAIYEGKASWTLFASILLHSIFLLLQKQEAYTAHVLKASKLRRGSTHTAS